MELPLIFGGVALLDDHCLKRPPEEWLSEEARLTEGLSPLHLQSEL